MTTGAIRAVRHHDFRYALKSLRAILFSRETYRTRTKLNEEVAGVGKAMAAYDPGVRAHASAAERLLRDPPVPSLPSTRQNGRSRSARDERRQQPCGSESRSHHINPGPKIG